MSTKKYYITTPLYYVNARPHIGHAYTNVICDTFARYHRLIGDEVFFLTGTDEHGTKIEKTAKEQNKAPRAYVDEMVPQFKELWATLDITYDYFIRTTDDSHRLVVQNILRELEAKGDIYKASYSGWYCTPCESFWTDLQLVEGKCPDCHREVQKLSEDNYFFHLAKYQEWLRTYIQDHPDFILPEIRKNEILSFLRQPLEDLCITRPRHRLAWGIDYPTSPDHVVYVWFDALINYVSAVGLTTDAKRFEAHWPADVHIVGKDILRQHAVYWPIILRACGVAMPRTILAHGWWTLEGAKVSKSRGNIVDPFQIVRKYGTDAFRFFLLKEVTLGFDGTYAEELLRERYTSDLANDLGNLWFRLASMIERYFKSEIAEVKLKAIVEDPLFQETVALWEAVKKAMLHYDPREALNFIWQVITRANQFVEENKPWVLAKDITQKERLAEVLVVLAECLSHVAVLLLAFLPQTGREILRRLHLPESYVIRDVKEFAQPWLKPGTKIKRGPALFPRLEESATS